MHITEHLLQTSYSDFQLIEDLESKGDNPNLLHTLDYCFATTDRKKAEIICSFVKDNAYGDPRIDGDGDDLRVVVEVQTPLLRNIVYNISANMVSISHIFGVEYIGWGTTVEKEP